MNVLQGGPCKFASGGRRFAMRIHSTCRVTLTVPHRIDFKYFGLINELRGSHYVPPIATSQKLAAFWR